MFNTYFSYVVELLNEALTVGLTMLEWDWLAENIEKLTNAALRGFLFACNFSVLGEMSRQEMEDKLFEFICV